MERKIRGVRPLRRCFVVAIGVTLVGTGLLSLGQASASARKALVQIGVMTSVDSTIVSYPQVEQAAVAAADTINAAGGIKGHRVKIDFCDDETTPSVAEQCANTMVQDHVIAVTGYTGLEANVILPILQKAGIPFFCQQVEYPVETVSKYSFPCSGGDYNWINFGLAVNPAWTKIGLVTGAGYPAHAPLILQGAPNTPLVNLTVDPATVNWTPVATQLMDDGVQAWAAVLTPQSAAALMTACAAIGFTAPFIGISNTLTTQLINLGPAVGISERWVGTFDLNPKTSATRAAMLASLNKYEPNISDNSSDSAVIAWLGPTLIARAGNDGQLKTLTKAGVFKWLSTHTITTGMSPPLNWTKAGPITGLPRIEDVYAVLENDVNSKIIPEGSVFTSLTTGAPKPGPIS